MALMIFSMVFMFILLFKPLVFSMMNKKCLNSTYTSTVKWAFITSMIPLMMYMNSSKEIIILNWHWLTVHTIELKMSFKLDLYSITFMPVALYVTWSIMEYSTWYMKHDPHLKRFLNYLSLFLITMLILVTANNMFQLFIGWEGVGIMSFLLIGWWYGRTDANTAALQAIIYNRVGDIGLVIAMAWFYKNSNSWELQQIFSLGTTSNLPLIGLILAAMGKSAQFGLHPWLPSAMEGPTPVSALLHSSTMVVAGVFLLIRFHPLMSNNSMIMTTILCIGAMTTLFTAICALTQNDIKKIIAFSTSSQLGLMMVTLGINQPYLSFLHICTHAFFKAMLFMCAGSIIHNLNDEQDIRKMGGISKTMPLTASAMTIGNLALMGTPFMSGFYSKDLIIESMNTSNINSWALITTLIATSLTAAYSTRLIYFVLSNSPRCNSVINMNESDNKLTSPIKRLMLGSIFAGFLLSNFIQPVNMQNMTMPFTIKITAMLVTIMGVIVAMELNLMTQYMKMYPNNYNFNFSIMLGFFPTIIHRSVSKSFLNFNQKIATSLMDYMWLEKIVPNAVVMMNNAASATTSTHKGMLKIYFMSFILSMVMLMLIMS
uniref:NADH-ubiquinone oxidoreductase chain 5 n=1 Tax=Geomys personatus TaxID=35659 RepID=NU5M_GEOPE|nr:RecName: Full=NADH-ubiquinone oxidoreductase chain 5; AltName: Full=NADH dehydrogenase subunit 5 [Geomys personatus]AAB96777.1 NADH-ubiquinone oxidoreductase subunit 5 [Geomys personatus subsp. maritimus]